MRSPDPGHPATVSPAAQPGPSALDTSRPFGAHLRMSWWKPLVLVLALPLVLVVLQVLAYQIVGVIEGSDDPLSPERRRGRAGLNGRSSARSASAPAVGQDAQSWPTQDV